MKALSLLQPWASLVAVGAKQWETRSRRTHYRGEIAIHASARFDAELLSIACDGNFFLPALTRAGIAVPSGVPLGSIIAVVEITDCIETVDWKRRYDNQAWNFPHKDPDAKGREYLFGNYARGRFAWKMENLRRLAEPVPAKGSLGMWNVPADIEAKVRAQMP